MHTHMHTWTGTHTHTDRHTYTRMDRHGQAHTHLGTWAHTYTHFYTEVRMSTWDLVFDFYFKTNLGMLWEGWPMFPLTQDSYFEVCVLSWHLVFLFP